MQEEQLRARLAELHRQLETGPELSVETRRLLEAVLGDIHRTLARPGPAASSEHEPLIDRLRGATRDLEDSHPRLTTAANQLIDALTRPFQ